MFHAASDSGVYVGVFRPLTLQARVCNKAKKRKGERGLGPRIRCECFIDWKRRGVSVPQAAIELHIVRMCDVAWWHKVLYYMSF